MSIGGVPTPTSALVAVPPPSVGVVSSLQTVLGGIASVVSSATTTSSSAAPTPSLGAPVNVSNPSSNQIMLSAGITTKTVKEGAAVVTSNVSNPSSHQIMLSTGITAKTVEEAETGVEDASMAEAPASGFKRGRQQDTVKEKADDEVVQAISEVGGEFANWAKLQPKENLGSRLNAISKSCRQSFHDR